METTAKESAAQRIERLKREKDGLEVLDDILTCAACGGEADADMMERLKWYGLYSHNQEASPDGGQYFMLRVRIPGGWLTIAQLQVLAAISRDFARKTAALTVRQTLQFYWIRIVDLPEIFSRLQAVGLSTQNASGDCARSIVTCPLAGRSHEELFDSTPLVYELNRYFQGNRDFSNLPRKFKIALSSCTTHCIPHEVQDLSFIAWKNGEEVLFAVSIGGGLGSNRRFATSLGSVYSQQILPVAIAVARLFRDRGNREDRHHARIGHLVETLGLDEVRKQLEELQGFSFLPPAETGAMVSRYSSHLGVTPSARPGRVHLGCAVPAGRLGETMLTELAQICTRAQAEGLALTPAQQFIITDIPAEALATVQQGVTAAGLPWRPSPFMAGGLACTGKSYCKKALVETKDRLQELIGALERRFPDFTEPVSIRLSGCPNGCSHPLLADIGLVGGIIRQGEERHEGFSLLVGGRLGGNADSRFATRTALRIAAEDLATVIGDLIEEYRLQTQHQSFSAFISAKNF